MMAMLGRINGRLVASNSLQVLSKPASTSAAVSAAKVPGIADKYVGPEVPTRYTQAYLGKGAKYGMVPLHRKIYKHVYDSQQKFLAWKYENPDVFIHDAKSSERQGNRITHTLLAIAFLIGPTYWMGRRTIRVRNL